MSATDSPAEISPNTLHTLLLSYESHVPDKIKKVEELRISTIPSTIAQRKRDNEAYLEKTEVISLVDWKLKHGTYRPNLAKLVASNSATDIHETTKNAFSIYEIDNDDYAKAITALSKLKGIGPATSSLLLSCYDPMRIPFFSDELYRYVHWEPAKSKGWDRKINYTIKEYKSLFEKVTELRSRLERDSGKEVSAIDIEKAAYVLGKNDALRSSDSKDAEHNDDDDDVLPPPPPKKRRRKATRARES